MKRRQYISRAGTATILGTSIAGCTGSGNGANGETTTEDTTDFNGSAGDGGDGSGGGGDGNGGGGDTESAALNECPMIPGSFTRFDPGDGPVPYSFAYPDIMQMEYAMDGPDTLATVVNGVFERNKDEQYSAKGTLGLRTGIKAEFSNTPGQVEGWYDERSNHETLLTTSINGEEVEFIGQFPEPGSGAAATTSFSEDRKAYDAMALVPYKFQYPDAGERARYHRLAISADIQLPETEVTSSCAGNLLETLERSIESIEMNRDVEAFEERIKDYSPP